MSRGVEVQKVIQTRDRTAISQHLKGCGPHLRFLHAAIVVLALISIAPAQQATSVSAGTARNDLDEPAANLAADTNVISIQYHCAGQSRATCSITVTKKQFDALVQALQPNMDQASRQSLATEYSRLLIMAAEARRRHIDLSPELQTLLAFSKLQLLADRLVRDITVDTA